MSHTPSEPEVKIFAKFEKVPDGFNYTYSVREKNYHRKNDNAYIIFALGYRYIRECEAVGLGAIDQIRKLLKAMPELEADVRLTLGAEVRADADREIEKLQDDDQKEMEYLDQLDTMGGIPPGEGGPDALDETAATD